MSFNEEKIAAVARLLAEARAPGAAIASPSERLAPSDQAEAWAIHQAGVALRGPVIGWKTGAPTPDAKAIRGEITADTVFESPATLPAAFLRLWAVEAEVAVTFASDLPPRETPYRADEVLAAVATWHAAIEVLDTAFADWKPTPALWKMADRQSHGALIMGPGTPDAPSSSLGDLKVRLEIDGAVAYEHRGGNTGGDPTRLLVALANDLAASERPIRAGDIVTTGSATPFHQATAGQRVAAAFDGLAAAELVVGA